MPSPQPSPSADGEGWGEGKNRSRYLRFECYKTNLNEYSSLNDIIVLGGNINKIKNLDRY